MRRPTPKRRIFGTEFEVTMPFFIFCMEPGSSDYAKKKKVKVTV